MSSNNQDLWVASSNSRCIECETEKSFALCRECNDPFCQDCFLKLHRSGKRKEHQWLPIQDMTKQLNDENIRLRQELEQFRGVEGHGKERGIIQDEQAHQKIDIEVPLMETFEKEETEKVHVHNDSEAGKEHEFRYENEFKEKEKESENEALLLEQSEIQDFDIGSHTEVAFISLINTPFLLCLLFIEIDHPSINCTAAPRKITSFIARKEFSEICTFCLK